MCCACEGGVNTCYGTAGDAVDSDGDGCEYYDSDPSACGYYDTSEFDANAMCCACGGGFDGWWEDRSLLIGMASAVPAQFEITCSCLPEANQAYAALDDILPSGRWAYRGVSDPSVGVGFINDVDNHDADCDGTFDWTTGVWVMNSYAYDPADGVCSYKAYVAASSADEMHVPYADLGFICPGATSPTPAICPSSKKTSSPSMNSYLIVAAVGAVVVIAAGSLYMTKRKPPSKGFSAPMVKEGTIEIPASQVTTLSSAQGTVGTIV